MGEDGSLLEAISNQAFQDKIKKEEQGKAGKSPDWLVEQGKNFGGKVILSEAQRRAGVVPSKPAETVEQAGAPLSPTGVVWPEQDRSRLKKKYP